MSSLSGKVIGATFKDILTVHGSVSNEGLETSLKKVEDGATVELFDFKGGQTWRFSKNGKTIVRGFKSSGDVPDLIQELNS